MAVTGGHGGAGGSGGAGGAGGKPGLPGEPGKPGTKYVWQVLPYLAAVALALYTFHNSEDARDQFCSVAERIYITEVDSLERTYDYLTDIRPRALDRPLTKAVVQGLEGLERRVQIDARPPPMCNEGSIFHGTMGVDAPIPEPPKRPKAVDRLLQ